MSSSLDKQSDIHLAYRAYCTCEPAPPLCPRSGIQHDPHLVTQGHQTNLPPNPVQMSAAVMLQLRPQQRLVMSKGACKPSQEGWVHRGGANQAQSSRICSPATQTQKRLCIAL